MQPPQVILVNEHDEPIGVMDKMEAHEKAILHRAFSVFIFNNKGEMLLQQRALNKYHSGGLWTNACCSHPLPGEEVKAAAVRRLKEEMGFTTELKKVFDFIYEARFENGLTEHEFDHVFVGSYNGEPDINPDEVRSFRYQSIAEIKRFLQTHPHHFTAWFQIAFPKLEDWLTLNPLSVH